MMFKFQKTFYILLLSLSKLAFYFDRVVKMNAFNIMLHVMKY